MEHENPSSEPLVREFVIAGHGNLPKVVELLEKDPGLLNVAYSWSETDKETAIQGAAQVGSVKVAEFLLEKGAPLSICTAAMLGRTNAVEKILEEDPEMASAVGAHGIPLLTHAALSGDAGLVELVWSRGAKTGATGALHNSVARRKTAVSKWLLENASPDLTAKNYEGKTALALAISARDKEAEDLLRRHGAKE